jgi:quercetin dioxygenase-like cupin family protein
LEGLVKQKLIITAVFTLALGLAVGGFALATPGSGAVSVEYARHTFPKFNANFENGDIVVTEFSFAPGGVTGWHSHPGKVIVGVARGSITLYRGNNPSCAGTTYNAGDVWIERPGQVHEARNEGTVAAVVNATYLNVAIGQSPRIDEAKPANCA